MLGLFVVLTGFGGRGVVFIVTLDDVVVTFCARTPWSVKDNTYQSITIKFYLIEDVT